MRKKIACLALVFMLVLGSNMTVFAELGTHEPKSAPICCEIINE